MTRAFAQRVHGLRAARRRRPRWSVRGGASIAPPGGGSGPRRFANTRRARLILLSLTIVAGLLSLAARCAYLQVVRAPELLERARAQQERRITLDPPRGPFVDRHGKELAVSLDVDSVFAEPGRIADPAAVAHRLAPILELRTAELRSRLDSDRQFVWLRRKVTPDLRRRIEALGLKGIGFMRESRRFYPKNTLAAHVLGACGVDNQGLAGLEFAYDKVVRGTPGEVLALRDGRGGLVFDRQRRDPQPGSGLVLTIDEVIQHVVERELEVARRETSAEGATAVVMDPQSGEILALASLPAFDPNRYGSASESARRNRALTDFYEPGSTFKMVTAAAALDRGRVHPNEVIWCENGSIVVAKHRFDEDRLPFGNLTFTEVLAKSSNVGTIKVARRLQAAEFLETIHGFGFGRRTAIDLPGESPGMLRDLDDWSGLSIPSISMGQEIGVTTVQLAAMTAAIANDGVWMPPHVVRTTLEPDGRPAAAADAPRGHRVIADRTARTLRRMLQAVTIEGTGRAAALPGYSVGGKTGTAQKVDASGRYAKGTYVSWFAGFVPAGRPALAIVVMVDEPRGARFHGGDVAAPVFARIAEPTLKYLGVPPDGNGPLVFERTIVAGPGPEDTRAPSPAGRPVESARHGAPQGRALPAVQQATARGAAARGDRSMADIGAALPITVRQRGMHLMPDVVGLGLRRATEALAAAGLTCRHDRGGPVATRQAPEAGAPIAAGAACSIVY
jgi:cell division protein FtsI/penicillin-binding protein 2